MKKTTAAFSLIELLVSMSVLSILLVLLFGALGSVSSHYLRSEQAIEASERGRSAIELITRELTPAVVDTRMQFAVIPGDILSVSCSENIVSESPMLLWMAPLGKDGELRCVGYYLSHNPTTKKHRLKRIYIRNNNPDGYFPKLINSDNARDTTMRTSPVTAEWFTNNWGKETFDDLSASNDKAVVSPVTEGVLGFWVQCYDTLGNPIPWLSEAANHPKSDLMFNSASYFHMANSHPFDDDTSFVYLAETPLVMKAHRLPAEIEIAMFTLGKDVIENNDELPEMKQILTAKGTLDIDESVRLLKTDLEGLGIFEGSLLTTRVKLTNGG